MYTINEDDMIYGFLKYKVRQTEILSFLAIFCPFSPLTTWKIKFLNLKKTSGDIIILHICAISEIYS